MQKTGRGIYRVQKQGEKKKKTEKGEEESDNGTVSGAMPDLWPVGNKEKLKQAKRESNWHAPWQIIGKCHGGAT